MLEMFININYFEMLLAVINYYVIFFIELKSFNNYNNVILNKFKKLSFNFCTQIHADILNNKFPDYIN